MADPSLESLFQINKDGIRNKPSLEREMVEKISRKHSNDLLGLNSINLELGGVLSLLVALLQGDCRVSGEG